jgi:hypothetical protein
MPQPSTINSQQILKHEWRKHEKAFYLPKNKPEFVDLPEFGFYTISGSGNPNSKKFPDYIQALYAVSYALRMSPKKNLAPKGYFDYTVYPLEGVWDLSEEGRKKFNGVIDKNELVFTLMIRQPDFLGKDDAKGILDWAIENKDVELLKEVKYQRFHEGPCVQMMHVGPYDNEPESFARMETFAQDNGLIRLSKKHREIYLSDARKTAPDTLKTILRFQLKSQ